MAIKKSLVALLAVFVLSGATLTQAQRQTNRGNNFAVRRLILRIQNDTTVFRNNWNAQSQTRIRIQRPDNVSSLVEDLDRAVLQLREGFDRRQSTTADVQEVLNRGAALDRVMI